MRINHITRPQFAIVNDGAYQRHLQEEYCLLENARFDLRRRALERSRVGWCVIIHDDDSFTSLVPLEDIQYALETRIISIP